MIHRDHDTHREKYTAVPDDLTSWDRWVTWRFGKKGASGKRAKEPVDPATGRLIDCTDPDVWLPYETAIAAAGEHGHGGVGFVLSPDDPFTVFDFDGCGDKDTGHVHPAVLDTLLLLGNPYSEWSPSGRGIRAVVRATKPEGGCSTKKTPWGDEFAVFSKGKFFTVTGEVLHGGGVPDAQGAVDALHAEFLARPLPAGPRGLSEAGKAVSGRAAALADDEVLDKARNCPKTGTRFAYLYDSGSAVPEGERSEADMFLCSRLAFWTGCDDGQMKRIFRASDLARGKYAGKVRGGRGDDYLDRTVDAAIRECHATYDPGHGDRMKDRVRGTVLAHVEKLYESGPAGSKRDVMLMLLDTADNHGTYRDGHVDFNDNQSRIADALGITQEYVSKIVRALISRGLLLRTSVGRQGKNSYYRLPRLDSSTMYVGGPTDSSTIYATHVRVDSRTTGPTEPRPEPGVEAETSVEAGVKDAPHPARESRVPTGPADTSPNETACKHSGLGVVFPGGRGCYLCDDNHPLRVHERNAGVLRLDAYRRVRGAVA